MQGLKLACPAHGFFIEEKPPAGILDGLTCYVLAKGLSSANITASTPSVPVESLCKWESGMLFSDCSKLLPIIQPSSKAISTPTIPDLYVLIVHWDSNTKALSDSLP